MKLRTLARKTMRNRTHPVVAVGVGLGVTQVCNFVTTAWLHRSLAHNAVAYNRQTVKLFDLIIRCATGMEPNEWAAVHQQHHAHSDELGDPHSPVMDGLATIQFNNVGEYKAAAKTAEVQRRRALLTPTPFEHHKWLSGGRGLIFGVGTAMAILGPINGMIVSVVHWPTYISLSASVNASHAAYPASIVKQQGRLSQALWYFYNWRGYRSFDTNEYSTNQRWLAWLTMGEGLHNNHHGNPRSPLFASQPDEFDLGWQGINLLQRLNLAQIRSTEVA